MCNLSCKNENDVTKKQECEEKYCKTEKKDTVTEEDVEQVLSEV